VVAFINQVFLNSDQPVDRYKFARACIIAGKMALEEHDDIELAISMFEKAISWYPENERLLEESVLILESRDMHCLIRLLSRTLKLKKRLRGDSENREGSGQRSLSSAKTPSKLAVTSRPLASARNTIATDDKVQRRQIFQFDVEKEETAQNKQGEKESGKKKKDKKSKSRGEDANTTGEKNKPKGKRKGRAIIEAVAAAFADSEVEEVEAIEDHSQDSEAEVEKSLQAELLDILPPAKVKNKRKGRKRKSAGSDEEYRDLLCDRPKLPKELPPKRRRIIF
jgi:hypothetical protein